MTTPFTIASLIADPQGMKDQVRALPESDRKLVTGLSPLFIAHRVKRGELDRLEMETSEAAMKAAVPASIAAGLFFVVALKANLAMLHHLDPTDRDRIRNLAVQLAVGDMSKAKKKVELNEATIQASLVEALSTARATHNAVAEYLCG